MSLLHLWITTLAQVGSDQPVFDVAAIQPVSPVTEIVVMEFVLEQANDAVLGGAFGLADFIDLEYP